MRLLPADEDEIVWFLTDGGMGKMLLEKKHVSQKGRVGGKSIEVADGMIQMVF